MPRATGSGLVPAVTRPCARHGSIHPGAGAGDRFVLAAPWTNPALFAGAGIAAAVALVFLRQQRRLITEFSQTEALALRREKELQVERELGVIKNRFVSMVSHEFRTPLGISMWAVGLLRKYAARLADAKRRERIADIESSTNQMAKLMEQALVLGRIEVDSVAGAGTTFTVTLPLFAPGPRPAPSPDA